MTFQVFSFSFTERPHHEPIDVPSRKHVRVQKVNTEFYRRNGIEGLALEMEH